MKGYTTAGVVSLWTPFFTGQRILQQQERRCQLEDPGKRTGERPSPGKSSGSVSGRKSVSVGQRIAVELTGRSSPRASMKRPSAGRGCAGGGKLCGRRLSMKEQITEEQIREALCLRHTEAVQKKLSAARTAVAGLGGLGSPHRLFSGTDRSGTPASH